MSAKLGSRVLQGQEIIRNNSKASQNRVLRESVIRKRPERGILDVLATKRGAKEEEGKYILWWLRRRLFSDKPPSQSLSLT